MDKLKPCPLCGGTPLLSKGPYDWDCGGRYYYNAMIECACGLTFEMANPNMKEYTSDAEALNFIIDAWNARAERTCKFKPFKTQRSDLLSEGVCSECSGYMHSEMLYCPNCGSKVVDE